MGYRYRTGDRVFGGSAEPRFNPSFGGDRINTKLGPRLPNSLVRATSGDHGCLHVDEPGHKTRIGIPDRFKRY